MKKFSALLLAALLCACAVTALATEAQLAQFEEALPYDAATYTAAYADAAQTTMQTAITWTEPVEIAEGFTACQGTGDGLADVMVFIGPDATVRAAYASSSFDDASMTDATLAFGKSAALIVYASSAVENGGLANLSVDAVQAIQTELTTVVANLNTLDLSALDAQGSVFYGEVAGHVASLFISRGDDGMINLLLAFSANEITEP